MNIHFISLGCSKNQVDTEQILGALFDRFTDITLVSDPTEAEYVFINTCGFLAEARDEAYAIIREFKKKKVFLLGCLTPYVSKEIFRKYPQIKGVLRQSEYSKIPEIIQELEGGAVVFDISSPNSFFDTTLQSRYLSSSTFAYLKIAEGCDNNCSYCTIPAIRGKFRSKPIDIILAEAKMLLKSGIKEIILIAQDTSYYGIDIYKKPMLAEILMKLSKLPIPWIRLHYTYPDRLTEKVIDIMAKYSNIVPYLDIPFQHADPEILTLMHRQNNITKWEKIIQYARKKIPNSCFRTTFIVGFPGEKKEHFERLKAFLTTIQFDRVGFFPYSREKGTSSYTLSSQVTEKTKQERLKNIMAVQEEISKKKNQGYIGQQLEILVESYDKGKNIYIGRSYRDSPSVDGVVFVSAKQKLDIGSFHTAKITKANAVDLWGTFT